MQAQTNIYYTSIASYIQHIPSFPIQLLLPILPPNPHRNNIQSTRHTPLSGRTKKLDPLLPTHATKNIPLLPLRHTTPWKRQHGGTHLQRPGAVSTTAPCVWPGLPVRSRAGSTCTVAPCATVGDLVSTRERRSRLFIYQRVSAWTCAHAPLRSEKPLLVQIFLSLQGP